MSLVYISLISLCLLTTPSNSRFPQPCLWKPLNLISFSMILVCFCFRFHKCEILQNLSFAVQLTSLSSVQFSRSVVSDFTPGLSVHHQLPEFTQTHVHRVSEAIQLSHPLLSPSPAPNPSQHQSLFQ